MYFFIARCLFTISKIVSRDAVSHGVFYGGREGSRAHAVAPVAAALSGTAARDADAPLRALRAVIQFLIT